MEKSRSQSKFHGLGTQKIAVPGRVLCMEPIARDCPTYLVTVRLIQMRQFHRSLRWKCIAGPTDLDGNRTPENDSLYNPGFHLHGVQLWRLS